MNLQELITYLKGRKVYLKQMQKFWPAGCGKEKTTQARLFEVIEMLNLLEIKEK